MVIGYPGVQQCTPTLLILLSDVTTNGAEHLYFRSWKPKARTLKKISDMFDILLSLANLVDCVSRHKTFANFGLDIKDWGRSEEYGTNT